MERFRIWQRLRPATVAVLAVLCGAGLIRPTQAQVTLTDLGNLGGPTVHVSGMSGDGKVIVGSARLSNGTDHAFRWTAETGMADLGTLGYAESGATAVNGDGSVVVGRLAGNVNGSSVERAFLWTAANGMRELGTLGGSNAVARAVSADGTVVVGYSSIAGDGSNHVFRWTAATGMQDLGPMGANWAMAWGISPDAKTIVGWKRGSGDLQAFRWSTTSGVVDLKLAENAAYNIGLWTNYDGTLILGTSFFYGTKHYGRGTVWLEDGSVRLLSTLGGSWSDVAAVTRDGRIYFGSANNSAETGRACLWNYQFEAIDFADYLSALGVHVPGWEITAVGGVSDDGSDVFVSMWSPGAKTLRAAKISGLKFLDTEAPKTALSISPPTPASGWHTTKLKLDFYSIDKGGAGVREIRHSVNMGSETVVAGDTASFNVSTDGIHSVAYWAIDSAGNVEATNYATVKIDSTVPTVAATVVDRLLTVSANDSLSGLKSVHYKIDNGATQTYTGPVTLPASAVAVSVWAEDNAGNLSETQRVAAGAILKALAFAPSRVASGSSTVGTVELVVPAPTGGLVLDISSSHPAVLAVPATVTVNAGATKATFSAAAAKVSGDTAVDVRVSLGEQVISRGIGVFLPGPKSLTIAPTVVTGGGTATATVTLASKAPTGGIDIALTSLDPSVATVPASVTIPAGATSATFTVATSPVASDRAVLVTAAVDGETTAAPLWVRGITVVSASLSPSSVVGGNAASFRVVLSRAAPTGGTSVAVSVASDYASAPATLTVAAGATAGTVTITTRPVPNDTVAILRARLGGASVRADLAITAPRLNGVGFVPNSLQGGQSTTGTIALTGKAPAGGVVVRLRSSTPAVTVPATIMVPGGATSATFTATTTTVSAQTAVTVTAVQNRDTKAATLTVRP